MSVIQCIRDIKFFPIEQSKCFRVGLLQSLVQWRRDSHEVGYDSSNDV